MNDKEYREIAEAINTWNNLVRDELGGTLPGEVAKPIIPDTETVRPALRKPDDALPAQARTRLQARGIPAHVVTGKDRRETADKVKAWCRGLPRVQP